MRLSNRTSQSGDTIIEVILAFAVFSLVAVGAIALMNNGVASAQRSLEITQVRQQIDAQASMLRYIHQAHVSDASLGTTFDTEWAKTIANPRSEATNFGNLTALERCPDVPSEGFFIDPRTATVSSTNPVKIDAPGNAPPYSQVVYAPSIAARGLWIEAVPHAAVTSGGKVQEIGYVDFHIRACWDTVGHEQPMTLGTIVRLYEPVF